MTHHLAQINIARFRHPVADPVNADFVGALDRVNAIAEVQPGFIWRLVGAGNNALDLHAYDDPNIAVNISVWESLEALSDFVYRNPAHREILMRRRTWFEPIETHMALWWTPQGHLPTVDEGRGRLEYLQRHGPTPAAFRFNAPFAAPVASAWESLA